MINRKEFPTTHYKPVSFQCDKCKKVFDIKDTMEIQEFHHIQFEGGFGSVFGDGERVECDLCQGCLYDMIKDCYRGVCLR